MLTAQLKLCGNEMLKLFITYDVWFVADIQSRGTSTTASVLGIIHEGETLCNILAILGF